MLTHRPFSVLAHLGVWVEFAILYRCSFTEICRVQRYAYFPVIQMHSDQAKMLSGSLTICPSNVYFHQSLDLPADSAGLTINNE